MDIKEKTFELQLHCEDLLNRNEQLKEETKSLELETIFHIDDIQNEINEHLESMQDQIGSMVEDMQKDLRKQTEELCLDIKYEMEALDTGDDSACRFREEVKEIGKTLSEGIDFMSSKVSEVKERSKAELDIALEEIIQQAKESEVSVE